MSGLNEKSEAETWFKDLWKKPFPLYLGLKPSFQLSAVFSGNAFIVLADVSHNFVEVFLWLGVDFHMNLTAHLGACSSEVLQSKNKAVQRYECITGGPETVLALTLRRVFFLPIT